MREAYLAEALWCRRPHRPGGPPRLRGGLPGVRTQARSLVSVRGRRIERGTSNRTVSRAAGASGAAANGYSSEPAISADDARGRYTSTAGNLSARKPPGLAGVFLRDLRRSTTTLLSERGTLATVPAAAPPPTLQRGADICPLEPWHDPKAAAKQPRAPRPAGLLQPLAPVALAPPPPGPSRGGTARTRRVSPAAGEARRRTCRSRPSRRTPRARRTFPAPPARRGRSAPARRAARG